MVPSDIRIAREGEILVGRLVLEHLEDRLATTAVEAKFLHHGIWMHVEMLEHPHSLCSEGPEPVHVLTADDLREEVMSLLEIRHGEANVVDARQAR